MALTTTAENNAMNFTENQHGNAILEKLRNQKDSGRFCDVILHVQGRQFQAHRNVLAACSPYFDSILKMHKIVKEQLTITCQNHEVFQCLLNYMYTGNVIIDQSNVAELLRLANHFLVAKLKSYCAEYLDRTLDVTNCLSIREMAEKYNMPALVKNSTSFVQNNIDEVVKQAELLEFPLTKLEAFLADKNWTIPDLTLAKFVTRWVKHSMQSRERDLRTLLTFVNWHALEKSSIVSYLEAEALYKENHRCFYFVLQSLLENNIHLNAFVSAYRELKAKFGEDAEHVDSDSFLNMAISTAIEGLQESKSVVKEEPTAFENDAAAADKEKAVVKQEAKVKNEEEKTTAADTTHDSHRASPTKATSQPKKPIPHQPLKLKLGTLRQRAAAVAAVAAARSQKRKVGRPRKIINMPVPQVKLLHKRGQNILKRLRKDSDFDDDDEEEDDDSADEDYDGSRKRSRRSLNDPNKEGIKCPHCCYMAHGTMRLEQHMAKAHAKDVTYKCGLCEFTCKWNREYYMHMKSHFDGPPFRCDSCEYVCDRIQLILTHRMKHTDERPFKCDECNYRCRTKNNLVAHMRSHTGEKPFKCETCGRAFAIKSTLDQHLATHSDDRPFLCDACGFSTKYQSHLIAHKRIHTGDVFRCQYPNCTYSSPKKSQLAAHMRTHMAIRSHICSVCGRGFIEKSHLVRHERIHLNDKPFKCDQCDYGSSRRDKLKEHVQKHHGENATAKTQYKPRKPRRQTFDPTCYPGRSSDSTSHHELDLSLLSSSHSQSLQQHMAGASSLSDTPPSYSYDLGSHGASSVDLSKVVDPALAVPPRAQGPPTMVFDPRYHGSNPGLHVAAASNNTSNMPQSGSGTSSGGNGMSHANDLSSLSAFMALF